MAFALLLACGKEGVVIDEPPAERGRATVAGRLDEHGGSARARLRPRFEDAGVDYPPRGLTFLAIKDEARLEVWAEGEGGALRFVRDYPVLAASGGAGPKLREGDGQVPEGVYAIDWLNPNSDYHLSMHIDYPNQIDRARAAAEGRTDLGGAIMVHGSDVSIGCLAMGDPAIEELFVLVADAGLPARIVIVPTDLRLHPDPEPPGAPAWTAELYRTLRDAVAPLTERRAPR
jgi:hypothetical protein